MYIFIKDDVCGVDFNENVNASHALETLIGSGFDGVNIINANKKTIDYLLSISSLSMRSKVFLKKVKDWKPQREAYYNRIPMVVYIVADSVEISNDGQNWIVPLNAVTNGAFSSGVIVLGENQTDAKMLIHAARHFSVLNNLTFYNVSAVSRGGGGETILAELNAIYEYKKDAVYCFLDSDKFSPAADLSRKARQCKMKISSEKWVGKFNATISREIENIIPFSFIELALDENSTQALSKINYVFSIGKSDFLKYVDLKKGLSAKWVKSLAIGSPCRDFWNSTLELIHQDTMLKYDCLNDTSCPLSSMSPENECECIIFPKVAERMTQRTLEWLNNQSDDDILSILKTSLNTDEWLSMGESLFWMACGPPKTRL